MNIATRSLYTASRPGEKFNKIGYPLIFACFILHQFGASYHLSFGSIGLLLLLVLSRSKLRRSSLISATAVVTAILFSFGLYVAKYDDTQGILRIGRFALNAFALFLLLDKKNSLPTPSSVLTILGICLLLIMVSYQNFFDPSFRTPHTWFALDSDTDDTGRFYARDKETLRASGPYSEPSVLGMVFCCLFSFGLRLKDRYRKISSLLCTLGVFLSGSLLGLLGLIAIYLSTIRDRKTAIRVVLIGAPAMALLATTLITWTGYGLAVFDRTYEGSQWLDVSTQARITKPFILIFLIFSDLNLFGFPGDIYTHYLGTGLYDSLGNFPGHNGFLGTVMSFGIFGLWFIWLLFRRTLTLEEAMLLIIIGSQSGNFFSYEKVFLMIFTILSTRGIRRSIDSFKINQHFFRS